MWRARRSLCQRLSLPFLARWLGSTHCRVKLCPQSQTNGFSFVSVRVQYQNACGLMWQIFISRVRSCRTRCSIRLNRFLQYWHGATSALGLPGGIGSCVTEVTRAIRNIGTIQKPLRHGPDGKQRTSIRFVSKFRTSQHAPEERVRCQGHVMCGNSARMYAR